MIDETNVNEPVAPTEHQPGATEQTTDKKWYVLHTYAGDEMRVQRTLCEHIKRYEMEDQFGEVVVPTEDVLEIRNNGQKRITVRNFYPGYVFVQMAMNPDTWHLVNKIPQVARFIGGETPVAISDQEAQVILDKMQDSSQKPRHKFSFAPGEVVRVIEGPFQDFDGTVEDVNYEKNKLQVSVSIFGRSTPVELDFHQVDKSS